MSAHVSAVCRSAYEYLQQLWSVTWVLSAKAARQWFMHSCSHVLTTVTRWCSASLTICSDVFRLYKTLQHVLLLDVVSTSCPSWGKFTGCQCNSALNSSWQFWCTKCWMARLHHIWRMTASLPDYRPTTTSTVQHRYVWGTKNLHKSGWSLSHCGWTASTEQPTSPST